MASYTLPVNIEARRYEAWKARVDRLLDARCGMTSDDLPDCCYYDWWANGISARSAALRAYRNALGEDD